MMRELREKAEECFGCSFDRYRCCAESEGVADNFLRPTSSHRSDQDNNFLLSFSERWELHKAATMDSRIATTFSEPGARTPATTTSRRVQLATVVALFNFSGRAKTAL